MSKLDSYKDLNKNGELIIKIDIEDLVKKLTTMNYGVHRVLSALVHELRARQDVLNEYFREQYDSPPERSELADGIEELLNKGYYK